MAAHYKIFVLTGQSNSLGTTGGGEDDTIVYFDNRDLTDHLYDQLHFDKEAKLMVGERFARAYLEAFGPSSPASAWGAASLSGKKY